MSAKNQSHWLAVSVLGFIVLVGASVRLSNLHRHSVTHVEMYVPGIRLPTDLVEFPLPRLNLAKVVSGCIRAEPHPPLYYMLMLGWTDLFGTSVLALRLPSALCGIACIPMIYALGAREAGKATGLVAAAMLALNGHQLFWSQFRGYIMAFCSDSLRACYCSSWSGIIRGLCGCSSFTAGSCSWALAWRFISGPSS